jgi:hypothetical protein
MRSSMTINHTNHHKDYITRVIVIQQKIIHQADITQNIAIKETYKFKKIPRSLLIEGFF